MDFSKTALVLVDMQKGILEIPTAPHSSETILKNAKKLITLFREKGGFIAFVRVKFHDGNDMLAPNAMTSLPGNKNVGGFSDFPDELAVKENDYIVDKRGFSGFFGTDLELQLRRRGIDTIVLGGIATHGAVDSTARDAYQYAYNQYFITDMMTSTAKELHDLPIENLFPLMGQTMTTEQFLTLSDDKS
ncbi:isochorismatase family protein [Streptococcus pacificus]|uniref:Isochorismatase family protein n=1 Tax=Streptococcus pacificus TaxID=2740577 RepID=A0ABS0ZH84_9STRE|nr:isochorismatase family protein [Streptococcus pacificus]MBJ8325369.1 isochorismatase family protein [Streptococcus pacificus]